ncbi:MAG: DNA-binding protein [Chryseobacterium sp.]|nr:MAG: DNA-binding protein [Chryseobacterium sp.]
MKDTKQDGSFGSLLGMKLLECSQNLAELKSEILTLTEVANLIGVSRRTCTNYRNELKIPFVRIDAKTVFFRSEVLKAMSMVDKVSNEKGAACKGD